MVWIRDRCCLRALSLAEAVLKESTAFPAGSLLLLKGGVQTYFRDIDIMSTVEDYERNAEVFNRILSECTVLKHRWLARSCFGCPVELIPVPSFLKEEYERRGPVEFWLGTNIAKLTRWKHEFTAAKFLAKLFVVLSQVDDISIEDVREHLEVQRKVGYMRGKIQIKKSTFTPAYYLYRYIYISDDTRFVEAAYEHELGVFSSRLIAFFERLRSHGIPVEIL
ncbi:hypothetical protein [Alphaspiravirus yamagawaense]|uniref:Uncharacterized protein n=1 Tax=Alphaspiravirus yamagawaense TaxID=1157339 RepID=J7Q212_9VIRU|nr:hypothetical protein [Aeropyrum coil-shaped virus]CCG27855.1 hypothetical protein [Aeropyrum coil-shaped virus]